LITIVIEIANSNFDPATLNWTSTVSMHNSRFLPTAVTLKDGRTLIAGGNYENTAEFFYY
jgi:type II secretory pathway component GspD/PulD (secretin)